MTKTEMMTEWPNSSEDVCKCDGTTEIIEDGLGYGYVAVHCAGCGMVFSLDNLSDSEWEVIMRIIEGE